jgi:ribosomal protein S19
MRSRWKLLNISPFAWRLCRRVRRREYRLKARVPDLALKANDFILRSFLRFRIRFYTGRVWQSIFVEKQHFGLKFSSLFLTKRYSPIHRGTELVETARLGHFRGRAANKNRLGDRKSVRRSLSQLPRTLKSKKKG